MSFSITDVYGEAIVKYLFSFVFIDWSATKVVAGALLLFLSNTAMVILIQRASWIILIPIASAKH